MKAPFLSIGITTYRRPELLKRCIDSLLKQDFKDFEIIVGNDYVAEELCLEDIGITDPRVKMINHKVNLGERGNLNFLLSQATGKYFTWQFDDDYYTGFFLEKVYALLEKDKSLKAVFTSYEKVFDGSVVSDRAKQDNDLHILPGNKFVASYLKGESKAMGLTGVYDTDYLKSLGGAKQLANSPYALYSEYLLLLHTAKQERVGYVSSPMVYFYVHTSSWGNSNAELDMYKNACENFYKEGAELLKSAYQGEELKTMLFCLLKLIMHDYYKKSFTLPFTKALKDTKVYTNHLLELYRNDIGKADDAEMAKLKFRTKFLLIVPLLKTKLKMSLPASILIPLQKMHAKFQ